MQTTTTTASGGMGLIGVNLSGGEYGSAGTGTLGTNYIYPSQSEIQYYAGEHMTVIRVPFLLERLEPTPGGPLDPSQVADLQQVVAQASAAGMDVILDPHNFGLAWGQVIGSTAGGTSNAQFANYWGEMAAAFKGDPNVIFEVMNEPNQQTAGAWAQSDNAAIAAIRQAGATQEILVPGSSWDGAWTFTTSGNSTSINPSTIVDPAKNWAIDVHQYLDRDSSGTIYGPVTDPNLGVARLTAITQWAHGNGAKLFLSEFGVPGDGQSLTAMQNMLSYMEQNSSVWQGGAYWAGGQWLGSYPFSIEPCSSGQNAPQMGVLSRFTPGGSLATGYHPPGPTLTPNDLVIQVPAGETVAAGQTVGVSGVSIADPWAAQASGTMALSVWDSAGAITIGGKTFGPGGGPVANGRFAGTETQLNALLAAMRYTAVQSGSSDVLTVDVRNQAGVEATKTIPITVTTVSLPSGPSFGAGADTLVLDLSEDAWVGDAKAMVTVNGTVVFPAAQSVTALHKLGQAEAFTIKGDWGTAPIDVGVQFTNDRYAGTPTTDRNLYVGGASYNGTSVPNAAHALYGNGTFYFTA